MFSVGNKELESRYRKIKYNTFSKNELRQEHLKLQKKLAEYQRNKYNNKEVENSDGSVSELNNDDEDVEGGTHLDSFEAKPVETCSQRKGGSFERACWL